MTLDDRDVFLSYAEEQDLLCKKIMKFHRLLRLVIVAAGVGWCGSLIFATAKIIVENWR